MNYGCPLLAFFVVYLPPQVGKKQSAMGTGASQGLAPRFESLPKFGKYPNSSRGVMAKAITPPPQLSILLKEERYCIEKYN